MLSVLELSPEQVCLSEHNCELHVHRLNEERLTQSIRDLELKRIKESSTYSCKINEANSSISLEGVREISPVHDIRTTYWTAKEAEPKTPQACANKGFIQ